MRKIRILIPAVILTLIILLCNVATATTTILSGSCGTSTIWFLDGSTLTLSGEGTVDSAYPSAWYDYRDQIQKVVIEEGITKIGDCIFLDHKNVTEIMLPDSLTHIGGQVFQGCDSLQQVSIPKNVEVIGTPGTYRTPATTFSCASLQCIEVASENKYFHSIDGVLFDSVNNSLLCYPQKKSGEKYTVPPDTKEISSGAFWFSSLQSIDLPDSVQVIGDSAFCSTPITKINIPNTVSKILRSTFENCDQLTSISIPASVKTVDRNAFASCDTLEKIIFHSTDCNISNITTTIPQSAVLYGHLNSAVQTYALTYGYKFVDLQSDTVYSYDAGNEGFLDLLPTNISVSCPVFNRITEGGNDIGGYQPTLVLETDRTNTTYQEMLSFVNTLTRNCTTDSEKAYTIYCWVNDNMTYEYARFGIGETADGIYQLWHDLCSNCEGYTQLTNFLLYLTGIPNAVATSLDHCWTVALLDGQWHMIDSTNRIFDQAPNDCDDIKNIFFGIDSSLVCVIDDLTGIKLASYGLNVRDNHTFQEITVPGYITHIYGSTFNYRNDTGDNSFVTIMGDIGSYIESYIRSNLTGYQIAVDGGKFTATYSVSSEQIPQETHVHSAQEATQWNESEHAYICSCTHVVKTEAHTWSSWTTIEFATEDQQYIEERSCTVCAYKEEYLTHYESESILQTSSPATEPPTFPVDSTPSQGSAHTVPSSPATNIDHVASEEAIQSNGGVVLKVCIVGLLTLSAIGAGFFFWQKRKK